MTPIEKPRKKVRYEKNEEVYSIITTLLKFHKIFVENAANYHRIWKYIHWIQKMIYKIQIEIKKYMKKI